MTAERTLTVPSFLTREQFTDPEHVWIDDLGPIVTVFVPTLRIGGWWMAAERRWVLQCPISPEEIVEQARRWLVASGQIGAARRHCEANGGIQPLVSH